MLCAFRVKSVVPSFSAAPRGREGHTGQTAMGVLDRGALRGWIRARCTRPSVGPPPPRPVGKHQATHEQGKGVLATRNLPCPPTCPGGPPTEPLYADLQRPPPPVGSGRTKTPTVHPSFRRNTQLSANSCAVSVKFYCWMQVSRNPERMFLRMFTKPLCVRCT